MDKEEKQGVKQEIKEGMWDAWKLFFTFQLVFGGHAIYTLAAEYPGMGILEYAFVLCIGAALMATVTLVALLFLIVVAAAVWATYATVKEKFSAR